MMMKSSRFEENKNIEENMIKDVRNLFRLRKLKKRNKLHKDILNDFLIDIKII